MLIKGYSIGGPLCYPLKVDFFIVDLQLDQVVLILEVRVIQAVTHLLGQALENVLLQMHTVCVPLMVRLTG